MEYAGFWARLAAYCIDLVIVGIGLLFVNLMLGVISMVGSGVLQTEILFQYTVKDILLYVLQVLYFILLTYGTGTTPGKRLLNLRVVNADGSRELDLLNVVYRETIGRFLCSLSVGIGYIMAGVDREKRGLHDMLCDTRVVYAKKIKVFPVYPAPGNQPATPPGYVPMPPQNVGAMRTGNGSGPSQNNGTMMAGNRPVPPNNGEPRGFGDVPISPNNGEPKRFGDVPISPRNEVPTDPEKNISNQEFPTPNGLADAGQREEKDS